MAAKDEIKTDNTCSATYVLGISDPRAIKADIDGSSIYLLTNPYSYVRLYSTATEWLVS